MEVAERYRKRESETAYGLPFFFIFFQKRHFWTRSVHMIVLRTYATLFFVQIALAFLSFFHFIQSLKYL
jgi:hypothetical protein